MTKDGFRLDVGEDVIAFLQTLQEGRTPGLLRRLLGRENLFLLERGVVEATIERYKQGKSIPLDQYTVEGIILTGLLAPKIRQMKNLIAIGNRAIERTSSSLRIIGEGGGSNRDTSTEPDRDNEEEQEEFFDRFREYAGRISTEGLQEIWGRLLAQQMKDPESVSLITLERLRTLGRSDAQNFERIASLALSNLVSSILPKPDGFWRELYQARGVNFHIFKDLEEAGLVDTESLYISAGQGVDPTYYGYKNRVIRRRPGSSPILTVFSLTRAGDQLATIPSTGFDEEWFNALLRWIGRGDEVSWREWPGNEPLTSLEQLEALFA